MSWANFLNVHTFSDLKKQDTFPKKDFQTPQPATRKQFFSESTLQKEASHLGTQTTRGHMRRQQKQKLKTGVSKSWKKLCATPVTQWTRESRWSPDPDTKRDLLIKTKRTKGPLQEVKTSGISETKRTEPKLWRRKGCHPGKWATNGKQDCPGAKEISN